MSGGPAGYAGAFMTERSSLYQDDPSRPTGDKDTAVFDIAGVTW